LEYINSFEFDTTDHDSRVLYDRIKNGWDPHDNEAIVILNVHWDRIRESHKYMQFRSVEWPKNEYFATYMPKALGHKVGNVGQLMCVIAQYCLHLKDYEGATYWTLQALQLGDIMHENTPGLLECLLGSNLSFYALVGAVHIINSADIPYIHLFQLLNAFGYYGENFSYKSAFNNELETPYHISRHIITTIEAEDSKTSNTIKSEALELYGDLISEIKNGLTLEKMRDRNKEWVKHYDLPWKVRKAQTFPPKHHELYPPVFKKIEFQNEITRTKFRMCSALTWIKMDLVDKAKEIQDPFSGKPFIIEDDRIISCGPDGVYNGGTPEYSLENGADSEGDIVIPIVHQRGDE
jgi:hypothetical protein